MHVNEHECRPAVFMFDGERRSCCLMRYVAPADESMIPYRGGGHCVRGGRTTRVGVRHDDFDPRASAADAWPARGTAQILGGEGRLISGEEWMRPGVRRNLVRLLAVSIV